MSEIEIKKSALSIPVMFEKTEEFTCDDDRFTKVKIWLMHLGENQNGSVFEKEAVDAALPTLEYIPIVGFIDETKFGEKDFSDHRYVITKDEKGIRRKYLGSAYGVILSSADNNAHYEERECDDGITRTFVVVDGVIWNMFEDSAEIINRDLIKGHSMELADGEIGTYEGYEDEDGLFHFTEFSFRAACILGDKYEPAMMNSTIEVQFTMGDFVKNLQSELSDKLNTFTKLVNEKDFTKLVNEKTNQEGGIGTMPNTDFTQTVLEQFSDISNMVREYETMIDSWGYEVPRFYLADIQDNEVIVVDRKDNYHYYGFSFTIDGDKPEIDFTSGNRKKIRYENYEEGVSTPEGGFDFGKHITEIEEAAFAKVNEADTKVSETEQAKAEVETNYSQIKTDYDTIKADYDEMKPKYEAYVQADEARQAAELDAQKDAKFAEFESALTENADFAALKERKAEMSLSEIESECAILYARVTLAKGNFSKTNNTSAVVGVMKDMGNSEGFVETKYGFIPVSDKK